MASSSVFLPDFSVIRRPHRDGDNWEFLFPRERTGQDVLLSKPCQVSDFSQFCDRLLRQLLSSGGSWLKVYLSEKADGHSCILKCHSNGLCDLSHRTRTGERLLVGLNMKPFLTNLAFKMQATFMVELCALYQGKEMGFLEVRAMLKLFKENRFQNVDPYQLLIRPFKVFSVDFDGFQRRGADLEIRDLIRFMDACIIPDNGLVQRVSFRPITVKLIETAKGKYALDFFENDMRVASNPDAFFDKCIRDADQMGIEGWVLSMSPAYAKRYPTKQDTHGERLMRNLDSVKVKREFSVNIAACKVMNSKKEEEEIWLFRKGESCLLYAGTTDNELVKDKLSARPCGFSFSNPKEREALYSMPRGELDRKKTGCFLLFEGRCTNLSKTHFTVIGLKYDLRVNERAGFDWLSNTEEVAMRNPHFVQTKSASDLFAIAIGRGQKKPAAPKKQAFLKRLDPPTREPSPPPKESRAARADTPPREALRKAARADTPPREEELDAMEDAAFNVSFAGSKYRVLTKAPTVWIDAAKLQIGPIAERIYYRKAVFLGANITRTPNDAVTLVVTSSKAIEDGVSYSQFPSRDLKVIALEQLHATLRGYPQEGI